MLGVSPKLGGPNACQIHQLGVPAFTPPPPPNLGASIGRSRQTQGDVEPRKGPTTRARQFLRADLAEQIAGHLHAADRLDGPGAQTSMTPAIPTSFFAGDRNGCGTCRFRSSSFENSAFFFSPKKPSEADEWLDLQGLNLRIWPESASSKVSWHGSGEYVQLFFTRQYYEHSLFGWTRGVLSRCMRKRNCLQPKEAGKVARRNRGTRLIEPHLLV